jgi:hypothetical protein
VIAHTIFGSLTVMFMQACAWPLPRGPYDFLIISARQTDPHGHGCSDDSFNMYDASSRRNLTNRVIWSGTTLMRVPRARSERACAGSNRCAEAEELLGACVPRERREHVVRGSHPGSSMDRCRAVEVVQNVLGRAPNVSGIGIRAPKLLDLV